MESTGPDTTTAPLDSELVEATGPIPVSVIKIDDLLNVREALLVKEENDRQRFLATFQPTDEELRTLLVQWASMGFPAQKVLTTVQIDPPPVCSDGDTRNFFYYCLYLAGIENMTPLMSTLETRVEGMDFDFILKDTNTFSLIVSKTN